ncbi:hypothetical protein EHR05_08780 [Leptospira licerasiae]|nr:hypothetical protein EHR05_08780 [Leptospira licerasiae]
MLIFLFFFSAVSSDIGTFRCVRIAKIYGNTPFDNLFCLLSPVPFSGEDKLDWKYVRIWVLWDADSACYIIYFKRKKVWDQYFSAWVLRSVSSPMEPKKL